MSMTHENAEALLSEFAQDALAEDTASSVRAHVAECAECTSLLAVITTVRAECRAHGGAFLREHPSSADVARAAAGEDISANVTAHLRGCPTCAVESDAVRAAQDEWRREPIAMRARGATASRRVLLPAIAACLLLAFPAYRGIVQLPNARRALLVSREMERSVRAERDSLARIVRETAPPPVVRDTGGAAPLLFFTASTRGSTDVPHIRPNPAVALQPIAAVVDVTADPAVTDATVVTVTIRHSAGTQVWAVNDRVDALWTRETSVLSVLVPRAALAPGRYVFTVALVGRTRPLFEAAFVVD